MDFIYKKCNKCGLILSICNFNKHTATKDGFRNSCIECRRLENLSYRKLNPEKTRQRQKTLDKRKRLSQTYNISRNARHSLRRARKNNATPKWLSEKDKELIVELYLICSMFKIYTGQSYHVDHIVPLVNDNVCGLHIPSNLRILLEKDNLSKNNTFDENLGIDFSASVYC